MIHSQVPLSAVFIYAAKSLGLFVALMIGLFFVLMIKRAISKRLLEATGEKKEKIMGYQAMKTPKEIEEAINQVYKKLDSLRKAVNSAVDRIGGVCHSVEFYGIAEEDGGLVDKSAKELLNAADEIQGYADDDVPHLATLLRERFEYDQEHCGVCDEPFLVTICDDERHLNHRRCQ